MLFIHGALWTGDPSCPWGEAMLLEGDRILAVGPAAPVLEAGKGAVVVDLGGAFLLPGLVDAHAHVLGFGARLERVDLTGAASLEETLRRVGQGVSARREAGFSGWIRGRGWDQNDWPDTRFPTRGDLDAVSAEVPVALTRVDGHALWVNSRALALAGITRDTPDPTGGKIHRDPEGNPTGILVDDAMGPVTAVIPESSPDEKRRSIERAVEAMARAGLTGAHDMGMSSGEAEIYRALAREGKLGVRIYGAISSDDPDLDRILDRGPDREWTGGTFRLGMVKFYVDGALGSRGAALEAPYSDDRGNLGLLRIAPDVLRAAMAHSVDSGFQCAIHAIGDRANHVALDVCEALLNGAGAAGHRATGAAAGQAVPEAPLAWIGKRPATLPPFRLEHAQILRPEDLPRLGALGVIASMQPTHCTSDMPWAPARLGTERLRGAYAWRSVVDGGAILAGGSDFPVESHEPRLGLYAAVTRHEATGSAGTSWSPEERLSRDEALAAFTAAPAYASGDLHRLGTLTAGKLADFVVFDRNLATCDPEDLLSVKPLLTVVGGKVLWLDASASFAPAIRRAAPGQ